MSEILVAADALMQAGCKIDRNQLLDILGRLVRYGWDEMVCSDGFFVLHDDEDVVLPLRWVRFLVADREKIGQPHILDVNYIHHHTTSFHVGGQILEEFRQDEGYTIIVSHWGDGEGPSVFRAQTALIQRPESASIQRWFDNMYGRYFPSGGEPTMPEDVL